MTKYSQLNDTEKALLIFAVVATFSFGLACVVAVIIHLVKHN
jgi:hypothetical protein